MLQYTVNLICKNAVTAVIYVFIIEFFAYILHSPLMRIGYVFLLGHIILDFYNYFKYIRRGEIPRFEI